MKSADKTPVTVSATRTALAAWAAIFPTLTTCVKRRSSGIPPSPRPSRAPTLIPDCALESDSLLAENSFSRVSTAVEMFWMQHIMEVIFSWNSVMIILIRCRLVCWLTMFVMLLAPAVTPPATATPIPTPVTIRDAPRVKGARISPTKDVIPPANPTTPPVRLLTVVLKWTVSNPSARFLSTSRVL